MQQGVASGGEIATRNGSAVQPHMGVHSNDPAFVAISSRSVGTRHVVTSSAPSTCRSSASSTLATSSLPDKPLRTTASN
ncbi:CPS_collapsed_G0016870.mRNA.1.CDS.1 [Saccharomyces cerevisiae]|nr:CPS_collapsed_G0016870.mRNA.1.CDS.1 [Saccharomyces cerevisiae]